MNVIEIKDLSKSFDDLKVINNLDMKIEENTVYGFIGKNGSGKTTTMRMILGFLKSDKGSISVCGEEVVFGNTDTNKYIGYLPDVPEFYGYMKPKDYLRLCGRLSNMSDEQIREKTEELLNLVGLSEVKRKIKGFSRGMKQRLGIAQALLNEPKILICDEPTSALDPVGRKEILDILSNVKDKATIIFSTHILSDVERICDTVGILNEGNLMFEGNLAELKDRYREDRILISLKNKEDMFKVKSDFEYFINSKELKSGLFSTVEESERDLIFNVKSYEKAGSIILKKLSELDVVPLKYEVMEPDLEQVFMEVIK